MTENASQTSEATELTPAEVTPVELTTEQEDVLEALRDVVDPELGINVVDLGLVYGVDVDAERIATIDMTLTSAACPLTDVIEDQAREALDGVVSARFGSGGRIHQFLWRRSRAVSYAKTGTVRLGTMRNRSESNQVAWKRFDSR
jgi:metal-sulfur cluster biosynthetic enzyme